MKTRIPILSYLFFICIFSSTILAQETPQPLQIEFEKLSQVSVGQAHNIHIHLTAFDAVDSIVMDISLPNGVTVFGGEDQYEWATLPSGAQRHVVLHLAFTDTIRGLFTVNIFGHHENHQFEVSEDLFLFGYGSIVEILTHEEAADYSQREWQTIPDEANIPTGPLSYGNTFIQLSPGEISQHRSLSFLSGTPFATIDTTIPAGNMVNFQKESATSIQTTVTGTFRFKDYNGNRHYMANAKVKIYDDDATNDDFLGSTVTNEYGYFTIDVSGSDAWPWEDEIEIYAKVCTENGEIVVSTAWTGTSHKWHTPDESTGGEDVNFGWQLVASGDYGACSVFEWMNAAWNAGANAGYDVGSRVFTHFPNHYNETSLYARGYWISNVIDVAYLGDIFIDEGDWDWNREENDISYHEFGHAFMDRMQDLWWPNNTGGNHSFTSELNPSFAWTEGWATAYAQFVETDGWYTDPSWFPIYNPDAYWQDVPEGHTNEARVAAAITDLFDTSQDGDDYIALQFQPLVEMLQDHNNDDLIEFWNNLQSQLSPIEKHYASRAFISNTIDIPLEPNPDPLSVTISGPSILYIGQTGTYTANVSGGGSNSISYQWEMQESGSTVWSTLGNSSTQDIPNPGTDFTVKVHVERGFAPAVATKNVQYGGKPPIEIDKYALIQNNPNPFNPVTAIHYALPEKAHVRLKVFNIAGQEVITMVNTVQSAGEYLVEWDGTDQVGTQVATGVYFYVLTAFDPNNNTVDFRSSKKMLYMK